jgi:cell division septation protein DedD
MADEGFHEIPLGGKQVVALFMAAIVVAVVIFLCGVMVGRGVRAEKTIVASADPASVVPPAAAEPAAGSPASGKGQQAAEDDANDYNRLSKETAPPDTLKPPPDAPPPAKGEPVKPPKDQTAIQAGAPPKTVARADAARQTTAGETSPAAPGKEGAPTATPSREPAAGEYNLQVFATKDSVKADTITERLKSKGYPAYLVAPSPGSGVYRVRVGKYKTKPEADDVCRRLGKEKEAYKPYVTR